MKTERKAGILMPISALPGECGIGTLGKEARHFVRWLKDAGMKIWQTLPLLPTNYGDSPYQACDSKALNPYFIDFADLKRRGLLQESDYAHMDWGYDPQRVDYGKLFENKAKVLRRAFSNFNRERADWKRFLKEGKYFDFGVFMALKCRFDHKAWTEWEDYRIYNIEKVALFVRENTDEVEFWQFTQYIFIKQWDALKKFAHENGVEIMGDMPIYVAFDSVEMWKYGKELFLLDENGEPKLVAGGPPDAFSDDGQLWGNPVYNWKLMKKDGYRWWQCRIDDALSFFDVLRIDHFRGFDRFYAIPSGSETAKIGEWMQGPSASLFKDRKDCNIVAEDLGVIDDGVRRLMKNTGYPGMKVLQFCFDGKEDNEYKPSNYKKNYVAYTGTHDNPPMISYLEECDEDALETVEKDLKKECQLLGIEYKGDTNAEKCRTMIKLLFASKAFMAIVPMQDVLCLGVESRMNFPSTVSPDNWSYRFKKSDFSPKTAAWLCEQSKKNKR